VKYPNNDLWTVRQIGLLEGALEDMEGKSATFYPNKEYILTIPNIAEYKFKGVLNFKDHDRIIQFEYGEAFGLTYNEIIEYLHKFNIDYTEQN
jgi:hypothetical protein